MESADLSSWNEDTWDTAEDLVGPHAQRDQSLSERNAEKKDPEVDGFAFINDTACIASIRPAYRCARSRRCERSGNRHCQSQSGRLHRLPLLRLCSAFWLRETGLLDRADDPAGACHGAQRRLEIARAMCTGPVLLCLDEPAAGLNPRESGELNELLLKIRDGGALLHPLIEHDMGVVMGISDRIVVLGSRAQDREGSQPKSRRPAVIAAYLGVEDDEVEEAEAEAGL